VEQIRRFLRPVEVFAAKGFNSVMKSRLIQLITLLFAILWVIVCLAFGQGTQPARDIERSSSLNIAYPILTQARD
jgi:hypothetical protein